jgi:hypothetical protein
MRTFLVLLLFAVTHQAQKNPVIITPRPGEILHGVVNISGTSLLVDFKLADLDFAYVGGSIRTWFLISESNQPVADGSLGEWDTTIIGDGDYDLRLIVYLNDGTTFVYIVPGLRVRNYSPTETMTPDSTYDATYPTHFANTPEVPVASSTPFQPNPVVLTQKRFLSGLGYGALSVFMILFLVFLYGRIRRK